MYSIEIEEAMYEKNLRVVVDESLKPTRQCGEAIRKANRMLGYIAKTVEFKSREVILKLYNVLVLPHLEYCVQFWSPYHKKDIEALQSTEESNTINSRIEGSVI